MKVVGCEGCKTVLSACKKSSTLLIGAALLGVAVGHVMTIAALKAIEIYKEYKDLEECDCDCCAFGTMDMDDED